MLGLAGVPALLQVVTILQSYQNDLRRKKSNTFNQSTNNSSFNRKDCSRKQLRMVFEFFLPFTEFLSLSCYHSPVPWFSLHARVPTVAVE